MEKAHRIWVVAPIARAVGDKTAKDLLRDVFTETQLSMDGNYNSDTITFIASRCNDVSCLEVITALQLKDNPRLKKIHEETKRAEDERKLAQISAKSADNMIRSEYILMSSQR